MKYNSNLYRELKKHPDIVSYLNKTSDLCGLFKLLPNISHERINLYQSLYKTIGNTPVVTINLPNNNTLFVKQECNNGMGNNHYSRYWIIHLALAESFGLITPQKSTILEISSGSSGIALSLACEKLGYFLKIIVPESLPYGRINAMQNDCTTIIKVSGYLENCKKFFLKEKEQFDYYLPNHSEEKADLISLVFSKIAIEFLHDYGSIDNVILGLGNGSSTYAIGDFFKKNCTNCKIFSFYPSTKNGQIVYGLYADTLPFIHIFRIRKEGLIYKEFFTDDIEIEKVINAFPHDLMVKEWGHSSIYAIGVALLLAERIKSENFFSIAYDKIERYF